MTTIPITALAVAERFVGIKEIAGPSSHPAILAMLQLDAAWPKDDATPWCAAFVNYVAFLLNLPRSKALNARSWLKVGTPVAIDEARPGFDVVVLMRGRGKQRGPDVIDAPGHVGFYAGRSGTKPRDVLVLGGNQGDAVTVAPFAVERVLGVRRLHA
jgi:uncharacterized protein (TIGR02594 family)